jgi:hypothetical protein
MQNTLEQDWCRWSDSNGRPDAYEAPALPTELQRRRGVLRGAHFSTAVFLRRSVGQIPFILTVMIRTHGFGHGFEAIGTQTRGEFCLDTTHEFGAVKHQRRI